MSEHQRAVWTMSSTISSAYNLAMQEMTANTYTTSEQHREQSTSRMKQDEADHEKVKAKLDSFTPFSDDTSLRNIITGSTANGDVNVHDLFTVGNDIVKKMDDHSVFSYSHKRSSKVKTLASSKAVKVAEDRTIDPALLFQRFLVVSQSGDLKIEEVMNYELCPYPMSLFEAKDILRQPDKPQLSEAIRNYASVKSDNAVTQTVPKTNHYVLDGGSLLHRLKWKAGCTYSSIADDYASFTVKHYGNATVVFDGYESGPSTKDCAHHRRSRNRKVTNVNITESTKFVGKKEDFLSNEANKQGIIHLIIECLRQKGCTVMQVEGDADVEIAKAAVTNSASKSTTLIGEDTDLLLLLLYYVVEANCTELYFRSDKTSSNVYNIKILKGILGKPVCRSLLFIYAFTGCDSTSRVFGIGKKSVFQRIIKEDEELIECSKLFCLPQQTQDVVESTGCRAMVALFNANQNDSLASIRYNILCQKVARAKAFVTPERLPPTSSACKFHSLRTYYQVMDWMGCDEMEPTEWGWKNEGEKLIPVMTDKSPAPKILLQMIHCSCSGGCKTLRCTCRKHGLECTSTCRRCQNDNYDNTRDEPLIEDEDEENENLYDIIPFF